MFGGFICFGNREMDRNLRFTIHASFEAILTSGLTPASAIAVTASCISLSDMLPCSVSTQIQSTPERAIERARLVPGSI